MEELNNIIRSCQGEQKNKPNENFLLTKQDSSTSSEDDLFAEYEKNKDKHKTNKNTLESSVELSGQKLMYKDPKLEKEKNKAMKNVSYSGSSMEKEVILSPSASKVDFVKTNEENFVQSVSFTKNSEEIHESVEKKFENFSLLNNNNTISQEIQEEDFVNTESSELKIEENKPETSSISQERSYNENANYFEM